MTPNLYEFLAITGLVSISTALIVGFRYTIYLLDQSSREDTRRRRLEWSSLQTRVSNQGEQAK